MTNESNEKSDKESTVYFAKNEDPAMIAAFQKAQQTFRYFWRELCWERRRIIPGLGLACVKVPFSDPPEYRNELNPECEQMWISDVDFDGKNVTGTLINSPNWLQTVNEGDSTSIPFQGISDWMYSINDRVYGAYTVNVMRAAMSKREMKQHDAAWGLDFGDPHHIEVVPADWYQEKSSGGFLKTLFGSGEATPNPAIDLATSEHPMSVNMGPSFMEALQNDPTHIHSADEQGWTLLHHQALAGSASCVEILLKLGADRNAVTKDGMTALQLANVLGWTKVARLLAE